MRVTNEPLSQDFFDMELIELKFNFDRREYSRIGSLIYHDDRVFRSPRQQGLWCYA